MMDVSNGRSKEKKEESSEEGRVAEKIKRWNG
jgi:hypothetical protein